MKKYKGIDYEKTKDCFQRTEHVESLLLYGDPDVIPEPLFTILIPTYKRVKLLKEAINSAITQWHVHFFWDIIVLDNEAYDGKPNDTEKLIRKLDNPRILYYRNSEHIKLAGDNFNRGFKLARGKWVMMLHDDDLLMQDALQRMEKMVKAYSAFGKPLGVMSASYISFRHDPIQNRVFDDVNGTNNYFSSLPMNYWVYKNTYSSAKVLFFFGNLPSNGSVFNRQAVLESGGFDEDKGTCCDIILLYDMAKKYAVYTAGHPTGFYRKGYNISFKQETIVNTIKGYDQLCEYIFSRNWYSRLLGVFLKEHTFNMAVKAYVTGLNFGHEELSTKLVSEKDYEYIHPKKPSALNSLVSELIIIPIYNYHKKRQSIRLTKKASKVNA